MHKVLVNCLVKLDQEKSGVGLTDCLDITIPVDCNKTSNKQTNIPNSK